MAKNSKNIRIQILNPPEGARDMTSLAHAKRYVKRGVAEWEGGALRFVHRRRARSANGPAFETIPEPVEIMDSGFGLLPYPQPNSKGLYTTLARRGAGMAAYA